MIQVQLFGPNDFNHSKLKVGEKIDGLVHAAFIGSKGIFVLISEKGTETFFSIAPLGDCEICDNFVSNHWVFEIADPSISGLERNEKLGGKIFLKEIFGDINFFVGFPEYNSEIFIYDIYDNNTDKLNLIKNNDVILLAELSQKESELDSPAA
jgi:hypothetical protein